MIRKIQWFAMAVTAVLCAACDAHIDVPDTAVRPGHILCEDGTALSYVQYEQSGKRAIAVVFDTEHREGTEGNGYAVYLWDIAPQAFADSLGIEYDSTEADKVTRETLGEEAAAEAKRKPAPGQVRSTLAERAARGAQPKAAD